MAEAYLEQLEAGKCSRSHQ